MNTRIPTSKSVLHILGLLMLAFLASCQHQQELREATVGKGRRPLNVVFDWHLHPDAEPGSMSLYLFPSDGGEPLRFEFAKREGAQVQVPVGTYTAIAFNSDNEGVIVHNPGDLESLELRLRDAYEMEGLAIRSIEVPRAPGAENERMTSAAGALWMARADNVKIDDFSTGETILLTPSDAVCHYTINVTGVTHLEGVLSLSASLSGMSGSIYPHDGSVSDENVSITFELNTTSESSLSGIVHTFGHCGRSRSRDESSSQSPHHLTVYAILHDGTRWYHSFDVTEHVHKSTENGDNVITVDGLELPEPVGTGGFSIEMGEWTGVNQSIQM